MKNTVSALKAEKLHLQEITSEQQSDIDGNADNLDRLTAKICTFFFNDFFFNNDKMSMQNGALLFSIQITAQMSGELVAAQNRANDSDATATQLRVENEKLEQEKNPLKEHNTWLDQELEKKTSELQKHRQEHYEAVREPRTHNTHTHTQTCTNAVFSHIHSLKFPFFFTQHVAGYLGRSLGSTRGW